jgi:hypothetical protein
MNTRYNKNFYRRVVTMVGMLTLIILNESNRFKVKSSKINKLNYGEDNGNH